MNYLRKKTFSIINKAFPNGRVVNMHIDNSASNNALSKDLIDSINQDIETVNKMEDLAVVYVTSGHPKIFCAGADLKERVKMKNEDIEVFVKRLRDTFQRFAEIKFPTVAAIDGFALGGGLELAMACDFRLATKKAILGLPEVGLGIIPGAGGTQRMARLIGLANATNLTLTGDRIDAETALKYNLVTQVAEDKEDLDQKAEKLFKTLLQVDS